MYCRNCPSECDWSSHLAYGLETEGMKLDKERIRLQQLIYYLVNHCVLDTDRIPLLKAYGQALKQLLLLSYFDSLQCTLTLNYT